MNLQQILKTNNFYECAYNHNNPEDERLHNKSGVVLTVRAYARNKENNGEFSFDILDAHNCPDILSFLKENRKPMNSDLSFLVANVEKESDRNKILQDINECCNFKTQS
jgi:hypothetical protein